MRLDYFCRIGANRDKLKAKRENKGKPRIAKRKIQGSFVALITPMNAYGSVDFKGFRTLLEFQEKNRTAGDGSSCQGPLDLPRSRSG